MSNSIFSGSSRYSTDFQQIIDRAVAIASLPLKQLTNQKNALNDQVSALSSIESKFSDLQTAINGLESAAGLGSLSASSSDSSVATASVGEAALPGEYAIDVVSLGSVSSALSSASLPTVSDPYSQSITTASQLTLTVDGVSTQITPSSNSLWDTANAINAAGAGVRATIVNLGSSTAPNYRLSLQSSKLAASAIQLSDGANDLLDTIATGSPAVYRVNGQPPAGISSDSRSVQLSPGLTVDLKTIGTTRINVDRSTSKVSDSLIAFVNAYNATLDELDLHRGDKGGALAGQSVVWTLTASLNGLAGYEPGGTGFSGLADLGIQADKNGKLSFNQATFDAIGANVDQVLSFIGGKSTGGFLQFANNLVSSVDGAATGSIEGVISELKTQISRQDQQMADMQVRIDATRDTVTSKIAAADALIASMEQQVTFFTALFDTSNQNSK